MSSDIAVLAVALGRVLLGGLFVVGGVPHFFALDPLTQVLKGRGVPAPRLSLIAASVFQILAGALLMFGLFVRFAALGLIVFTLVSSVLLVNFWSLSGEAREKMKNAFMSNLGIVGGLLIAAATAAS